MKCLEHPKLKLIISEMFKTLRVFFQFIYLCRIRIKSGQHCLKIRSTYRKQRGYFPSFVAKPLFAWSTWPENLVNKLGHLPNTFCTYNVQNMSKKNRGKNLFSKSLPRISLIISIFQVIPQLLPGRRRGGRWARGRVSRKRS